MFRTLYNMCYIILNVGLFQFYSTAVYIICYIKLILRLFLDYSNGFCIMCFCVPNTLQYVLYHIERCTVLVLQYCCLQIDLTFVPGLQQWLLHNVFRVPNTLQYVLYHIERWNVLVLQYCCLQIVHTVVPGLKEWFLHNVFLCSEPSAICVISY